MKQTTTENEIEIVGVRTIPIDILRQTSITARSRVQCTTNKTEQQREEIDTTQHNDLLIFGPAVKQRSLCQHSIICARFFFHFFCFVPFYAILNFIPKSEQTRENGTKTNPPPSERVHRSRGFVSFCTQCTLNST